MIIFFLLILISTNVLYGSHFEGGTITWAPVYPNGNSSSVLITLTQSYSWAYPTVNCTTNIPTTIGNANLTCVANCTTQGGFANQTISSLTDCTSYIPSLGMVSGQRSINLTLNENTYFWVSYRSLAWRTLQNGATGSSGWSIVSLINLQRRPDGLINTPPLAQVTSPQYVIFNTTTAITISVSDVNESDDLRCRWSVKNSSFDVDECADICATANLTDIASLSGCTLIFEATISGVWYAMALQVEDFMNSSSTSPISSVPIQFLIYVVTPQCLQLPLILNLTDCLEVQINVSVTFTLYVMNYCNDTTTVVTDLISSVGITGMTVSSLFNSTTNTSLSYVTLTWTPQTNQIGPQQFCAVAYTNERVQSNTYCVTFIVITSIPCITTNASTKTETTTTSTTSETAIITIITTATTSTSTTATTATITTATTTTVTTATTSASTIATTATVTTATTSTSSIATTATITTETTTTVTTATTMTTTSAVTVIQTTTITDNSNQNNIPLIVGLSVVGSLLILSCCCLFFWLYGVKRRKIVPKSNNLQDKQVYQLNYSNTKYGDDMQKRATRFAETTLTKIKTNSNKGKSLVDHSMSGIRPNNNKNTTRNRVTVISVKK